MGKQAQVAMTEVDEAAFLEFLRRGADIQIIGSSARTAEELFVDAFPPRCYGTGRQLRIWNRAFPLKPEFKQWGDACTVKELRGLYYMRSMLGGPLIEYFRQVCFTDIRGDQLYGGGRVYWNTDFAIHRGPDYDIQQYARWYDSVVRWIRKAGVRVELWPRFYQYWLPDANRLRTGSR